MADWERCLFGSDSNSLNFMTDVLWLAIVFCSEKYRMLIGLPQMGWSGGQKETAFPQSCGFILKDSRGQDWETRVRRLSRAMAKDAKAAMSMQENHGIRVSTGKIS